MPISKLSEQELMGELGKSQEDVVQLGLMAGSIVSGQDLLNSATYNQESRLTNLEKPYYIAKKFGITPELATKWLQTGRIPDTAKLQLLDNISENRLRRLLETDLGDEEQPKTTTATRPLQITPEGMKQQRERIQAEENIRQYGVPTTPKDTLAEYKPTITERIGRAIEPEPIREAIGEFGEENAKETGKLLGMLYEDVSKSPLFEAWERTMRAVPAALAQEAEMFKAAKKGEIKEAVGGYPKLFKDIAKEFVPEAYGLPSGYWEREEPQKAVVSAIKAGIPLPIAVVLATGSDLIGMSYADFGVRAGIKGIPRVIALARSQGKKITEETLPRFLEQAKTIERGISRPMVGEGVSLEAGHTFPGFGKKPLSPIPRKAKDLIQRLEGINNSLAKSSPEALERTGVGKKLLEEQDVLWGKLEKEYPDIAEEITRNIEAQAGKGKPTPTIAPKGTEMPLAGAETPKPSITATEQGIGQIPPPIKPPAPPISPEGIPKLPSPILPEELAKKYPVPPHIPLIEQALVHFEPQRVLLGRDPYGSEVSRIISDALENQNVLYKSVAVNKQELKALGKKVNVNEMIKLQELGVTTDPMAMAKLSINERRYVELLEDNAQKALELSKRLGKDVEDWRFVNRYFPRVWSGNQVIQELDEVGKVIGTIDITNRAEAILKLDELIRANPDKVYTMKPRYQAWAKETPVGLSQRQYFRLLDKLADLSESTVADVMEEVAGQGLIRIKPKKTYIGAFEFRKGDLDTYIKDPVRAYDALFYKLTKRLEIDPITRKASKYLSQIKDPQLRGYAEDLINYVGMTGRYIKPALSPKIVRGITSTQTALKMWGRLSPVISNHFQRYYSLGLVNGIDMVNALKLKFSPEGVSLLKKLGIAEQTGLYEGQGLFKRGSWLLQPTMFQYVETGNREAVALLGYAMGKRLPFARINEYGKKLGLGSFKNQDELATSYARAFNRVYNFEYTKAGTMPAKQYQAGQIILQFKDYPANHIANMVSILKGKPPPGLERFFPDGLTAGQKAQQVGVFFGNMFAQGGIRAVGFGMERLLPAGALTFLALNAPWALYGLPALLGVDISRASTTEIMNLIPERTSQLGGATVSDFVRMGRAIKYVWRGKSEKAIEEMAGLSPAVLRQYRAIKSLSGDTIKYWGKAIKLSTTEAIAYGLGLTPSRLSEIETLGRPLTQLQRQSISDYVKEMGSQPKGQKLLYLTKLSQEGKITPLEKNEILRLAAEQGIIKKKQK